MLMNESDRDRHFLIAIWYEGPWAKLSNWCYGIRKDGTQLWDLPAGSRGIRWLLAGIGLWADGRDRAWRLKYVMRRQNPPRIWKRR